MLKFFNFIHLKISKIVERLQIGVDARDDCASNASSWLQETPRSKDEALFSAVTIAFLPWEIGRSNRAELYDRIAKAKLEGRGRERDLPNAALAPLVNTNDYQKRNKSSSTKVEPIMKL